MNDPIRFFDRSITKMHQIPRDELELLQREAMARRFADHRESIAMVRKLADRLGIKELREFDDVVPLFFAHTAFKSYPGGAARQEALRPDDEVARQADEPRPLAASTSPAARASTSGSTGSTRRRRSR